MPLGRGAGRIGQCHQGRGIIATRLDGDYPQTGGNRINLAIPDKLQLLNGLAPAFNVLDHLIDVAVFHDHRKLVATQTSQQEILFFQVGDVGGNLPQELIPCQMAAPFIDHLKVVNIDEAEIVGSRRGETAAEQRFQGLDQITAIV